MFIYLILTFVSIFLISLAGRAMFVLYQYNFFKLIIEQSTTLGWSDILSPMASGLRFDVALAAMITLPTVLMFFLKYSRYYFSKSVTGINTNSEKVLYYLLVVTLLLVTFVDAELFIFIGRKLTADFLLLLGDFGDQFTQFVKYYWYLSILFFTVLYLFYKLVKKIPTYLRPKRTPLFVLILFLLIPVSGIAIRGGLQKRSISVKSAYIYDPYEMGHIAMPAGYAFFRTLPYLKKHQFPNYQFFNKSEFLDKAPTVTPFKNEDYLNKLGYDSKPNIVILIMESFSKEYTEEGFTPYLSQFLQQEDVLSFDKAFSNGRRSIEVLPSILASFPALLKRALYQSSYQGTSLISLPGVLKEQGYTSFFFHGGATGTMDFDAYTKFLGMDYYFGKEDYPNQDHFDGNWGIYDHHFLDFMNENLNDHVTKRSTPFFATFFSLSSHQPYSIPEDLISNFPPGHLEIHQSLQYSDWSLDQFFKKARKESWFENTIFVVTADHTSKLASKKFNTLLGRHQVPLAFYFPEKDIKALNINTNQMASHVDIFPTLANLMGLLELPTLSYGRSLLQNTPGEVINRNDEEFFYLVGDRVVRFSDERAAKFYQWDFSDGEMTLIEQQDDLLLRIQWLLQYTSEGLRKNKFKHDYELKLKNL